MGPFEDREGLKAAFDRDGYVFIRGAFSGDDLAALQENVARLIKTVVPTMPREQVYYEDKADLSTLKQLQQLWQHDDFFNDLMLKSQLPGLARTLLGDEIEPVNMQYFNKPPGVGQPTPAHQDGYYFHLTPCEALTMWLALDDVDEENGCVRYVPGSHKRGMRSHGRTNTLGFSQGITDWSDETDTSQELPMVAQPGDLLAHHALTIHRADGNHSSTRNRRSLGMIYYAESAKVDEDKRAAYKQQLEREMVETGKI
ncbi:phytanoyl-CoA dioxygenase family protein [Aeoliella sp.]|uniref:phytanoyl-CoA dioxygenase family protein n=1 Tax=Aeoliella sp. TaxID=2795800 RepID=UPI003CCC306C